MNWLLIFYKDGHLREAYVYKESIYAHYLNLALFDIE